MNQTILLDISDKQIGIVRNPYERIITLYRDSWDWIGLEKWLQKSIIEPQCELYKDCDAVVTLESWKDDFKSLGITPDKNSIELLYKHYSEDYRRWYGQNLKDIVRPIVLLDLSTYGYRF